MPTIGNYNLSGLTINIKETNGIVEATIDKETTCYIGKKSSFRTDKLHIDNQEVLVNDKRTKSLPESGVDFVSRINQINLELKKIDPREIIKAHATGKQLVFIDFGIKKLNTVKDTQVKESQANVERGSKLDEKNSNKDESSVPQAPAGSINSIMSTSATSKMLNLSLAQPVVIDTNVTSVTVVDNACYIQSDQTEYDSKQTDNQSSVPLKKPSMNR